MAFGSMVVVVSGTPTLGASNDVSVAGAVAGAPSGASGSLASTSAGGAQAAPEVAAVPSSGIAQTPVPLNGPPTCTITVSGENVGDNAVQTAINGAAPGSTICLGAGTYPEQLTIATPGITLLGAGNGSTIIEPNAPLAFNTFDFDSASTYAKLTPAATIVLVENTSDVTIENVQVSGQGAVNTFTSCADDYFGVDFQNSSGALVGSLVTDIELPTDLFGCQPGVGVYAYNGYFFTGVAPSPAVAVSIADSTITNYDKNGITCDDLGETCSVTSSTVAGVGPTPLIAQNGIQVAFGASGTITNDSISGNHYDPALNANYFGSVATATGVLIYDGGNTIQVADNHLHGNDLGIAVAGTAAATVSDNTITQGYAYGITFDLNTSIDWMGYPVYSTDTPRASTADANVVENVNVGILAYDDNVTITGGTMSNVNVSVETMVDNAAATYSVTVDSLTAHANVSGALLGNISSFQPTPGFYPKGVGTYALSADTFTANPLAPPAGVQDGILLNGTTASVDNCHVTGFAVGIFVNPTAESATIAFSTVTSTAALDEPEVGIWAGNQVYSPADSTGTFTILDNTVTGPGGATDSPLAGGAGILAGGIALAITGNIVTDYSAVYGSTPTNVTGPGSGYDWWEGTQSVGILAGCPTISTASECEIESNSLDHNTIGVVVLMTDASFSTAYNTGPVTISNNAIDQSGGYGLFTEMDWGLPGTPPTSYIDDNVFNNSQTGAPAMVLSGQTFEVTNNVFIGTSPSGDQGPTQGQGGGPLLSTASVEATDYWTTGIDTVVLNANDFVDTHVYCSSTFFDGSRSTMSCGELATFSEDGLASGTTWSVTVDGTAASATAPGAIVADLQNSTPPYAFAVAAVPGYTASPPSGTVSVSGSPVAETIDFLEILPSTFLVTVTESGLPANTEWFVNITGGSSYSSTGVSIGFVLLNGSYTYTVGTANTTFKAPGGSFAVAGAPVTKSATFSQITYEVEFAETGVPTGLTWYLNFSNGQKFSTTSDAITFAEPNGTYAYTFGATLQFPKWYSAMPGTLILHGGPQLVGATFVQVRDVIVVERNLPSGMEWWVNLTGGPSYHTTSTTMNFYTPAGAWTYTVAAANHDYTAKGQTFIVHQPLREPHVALTFTAKFHLTSYAVTVRESGLPSGSHWCVVVLGGGTYCSSGRTVGFREGNGTYSYTLTTTKAGFSGAGGMFVVSGSAALVGVTFSDPPVGGVPAAWTLANALSIAGERSSAGVDLGILVVAALVCLGATLSVRPPMQRREDRP